MSSYNKNMAFLALFLAIFPIATLGDAIPPFASPFFDKICEKVECGKGKCKSDINKPFGFTCECDDGWKRTSNEDINTNHTFLPCIIPKCTLNYACQPAPPPAPQKEVPRNGSFFDPCYWIYCGAGKCKNNDNDDFKHSCECNNGFTNLLNKTYFPCYGQCALGSDCSRLTTSSNVENSPIDGNQASSFLPGNLQAMTVLITSIAMIIWKL